jgi:hypothetical protein
MRRSDQTDDRRDVVLLNHLRDALGCLLILGDECRLLNQVAGRIAAHGKLWEDDQASTGRGGAAAKINDSRGIAAEITNGRVDLPQRDLHVS